MGITPGSRLGRYEILAPIGAGGMGEVYRARDTTLNRDVAIKMLAPLFTRDPERLARLRREAHVLASLNHPNIAQIHGLEENDGAEFLVLELVEGGTLADRIARGALPADEAIAIARQIGDALAAAHEKGIIHRDLKPANVAVTADGHVKVLDFGLAKALESEPALTSADISEPPTITSPAMTALGVILGTAAYMAPEQAKGHPADRRSDIWAFGCVLYEMLTGTRAFHGEDVTDTLAAILRGHPDWNRLPPDLPPNVRLVLTTCLARDRRQRFADINTPLFLLTQAPPMSTAAPASSSSKGRHRLTLAVAGLAGMAAVALTALVAWALRPAQQPSLVTRFEIPLRQGEAFTNMGRPQVAISGDGAFIAYTADYHLYVRTLSDPAAHMIDTGQHTEALTNPVFSPGGESIAYWNAAERGVKRSPSAGGASVTICTIDTNPFGMSWAHGDLLIGMGESGIVRVSEKGGTPQRVVEVKHGERAYGPQLLPDGDHVLFTLASSLEPNGWDSAEIVVQSLKTGTRTTILTGASDGRYLSTGHLLYSSGGVVSAAPFDARRLTTTAPGVPVIENVQRGAAGNTAASQYAVSDTGTLAYIAGVAGGAQTELAKIGRDGQVQRLTAGLPPGNYLHPRVSPNPGRDIAVEDATNANIWIVDPAGARGPRRLTFGGHNRTPVWSSDGSRVIFQSDREGDRAVFWQPADNSGPAERLTRAEAGAIHIPQSASRDGKWLLITVKRGDAVAVELFSFADRKLTRFSDAGRSGFSFADFSPNGDYVAYTGDNGTYVQPFPATGAKWFVMPGDHPFWSRDGRELFGELHGQLVAAAVSVKPAFTYGSQHEVTKEWMPLGPGAERNIDVMPDGHFVGGIAPTSATASPGHIDVVLNWFTDLKARLGSK